MKKGYSTKTVAVGLLGLLALCSAARANSTANISYHTHHGDIARFRVDFDHDGDYDSSKRVYTGIYEFNLNLNHPETSQAAKDKLGNPFYAFCIDLAQEAGTATYELVDLQSALAGVVHSSTNVAARANDLRELFGKVFYKRNSDTSGGFPGYGEGNKYVKEAFGAAVWEIVFEKEGNSYDIASGSLKVEDVNDAALANTWLAQVTGDSTYYANVEALSSETHQDFALTVTTTFEQNDPEVPEPMTLLAVLAGGGAVGGYLRRRKTPTS